MQNWKKHRHKFTITQNLEKLKKNTHKLTKCYSKLLEISINSNKNAQKKTHFVKRETNQKIGQQTNKGRNNQRKQQNNNKRVNFVASVTPKSGVHPHVRGRADHSLESTDSFDSTRSTSLWLVE